MSWTNNVDFKSYLNEADSPEVAVSEALSNVTGALIKVKQEAGKLKDGKRLKKIIDDLMSAIDEESQSVAQGEYS
jgi:hypothetical protein